MFGTNQTEIYVFVFIVDSIPGIYNDVHLLSIYLFCCPDFSKWRIYWVLVEIH